MTRRVLMGIVGVLFRAGFVRTAGLLSIFMGTFGAPLRLYLLCASADLMSLLAERPRTE